MSERERERDEGEEREGRRKRGRERVEGERENSKHLETVHIISQLTGKEMSADSVRRSTLSTLNALLTLVTSGATCTCANLENKHTITA